MARKRDSLGQRILSLLESEPNGLIWRDVLHRLWPSYEGKCKDIKSFSSVLTQKLARMVARKTIQKTGNRYGILKSLPITQETVVTDNPLGALVAIEKTRKVAERAAIEADVEKSAEYATIDLKFKRTHNHKKREKQILAKKRLWEDKKK